MAAQRIELIPPEFVLAIGNYYADKPNYYFVMYILHNFQLFVKQKTDWAALSSENLITVLFFAENLLHKLILLQRVYLVRKHDMKYRVLTGEIEKKEILATREMLAIKIRDISYTVYIYI